MKTYSYVAAKYLVVTALSAFSVMVQAQDPDLHRLEHVLVTVPIHRTEAETALPVTALSGDELRNRVANSIGETLAGKPGLASASFGPAVGQPVIRGQQGARVMVLQNSTGSGDASNSSADHAVSVEPMLAESIEVLRGPSTLLYGGGAIGGVVNVIDRRVPVAVPQAPSGALELRHGTVNDETTGVFALDGGRDAVAFHADGVIRESNNVRIPGLAAPQHPEETTDGYIANTDTQSQSLTLGSSYIFDRGYIGVAVNSLDNEYGIPPGAHDHDGDHSESEEEEENVRIDVEQTRYDVRADFHPENALVESVRWFSTYSDYQHKELEGDAVGTVWSNESWENRFELLHAPIAGWHGVAGMQITHFEFAAVGDESAIPRTDVSRYGLFFVEDFHHGDWLYELGARADIDELDPHSAARSQSFSSFSVSASTLWQVNEVWSLGVALSQSERAPVIEELYSNDGNSFGNYVEHVASGVIEVGDIELTSEQANNVDITVNYQTARIDGYLTLFYSDFDDYIYLGDTGMPQGDTAVYSYQQQGATFTGVEFEVVFELAQLLGGTVNVELFGDWMSGELDRGDDIPRLPPQRVGSRVHFERGPFNAYVAVLDASEQDKPGANEEPTDGYTRWDAGIDYRVQMAGGSDMLLFVKLKNLSDEEIRSATSFLRDIAPEPGRSIESGIRYRF